MATARVNGLGLYYEETGSGFPVMWCPEFGGNYRSGEPQVRYFGEFLAAVENGRWGSWKAEKPGRR
jgi:hypothetical protein